MLKNVTFSLYYIFIVSICRHTCVLFEVVLHVVDFVGVVGVVEE